MSRPLFSQQNIQVSSINNKYRLGHNRKKIFSQYTLLQTPEVDKYKKNERELDRNQQQLMGVQELLKRKLLRFKINIQSVLKQKQSILTKFNKCTKFIQNIIEYINIIHDSQSITDVQRNSTNQRKFRQIVAPNDENDTLLIDKYLQQTMNNDGRNSAKIESSSQIRVNSSRLSMSREQKNQNQNKNLQIVLIAFREVYSHCQLLKYEAEVFRFSNLSNFNDAHTKPVFVKTPLQSENQVKQYIYLVADKFSQTQEARVRFLKNWEQHRFLLDQEKYENCLIALEEMYSQKKILNINFHMLNILADFDLKFDQIKYFLETNYATYMKYQGLNDSYNLMNKQIKQMQERISYWNDSIFDIDQASNRKQNQNLVDNSHRLIKDQSNDSHILQKNIKIYYINKSVFAKYNTLTNLKNYSNSRNNFNKSLQEYEKRYRRWSTDQYPLIEKLYKYHQQLNDINRKKGRINKEDRETKSVMKQIQEVSINGKYMPGLYKYKDFLLNMDGKQIKPQPPRRPQNPGYGISQRELKIYQQFFKQLGETPIRCQKHYIYSFKNQIQNNLSFIEGKLGNISKINQWDNQLERIYSLLFGFKFCMQVIKIYDQIYSGKNIIKKSKIHDQYIEYFDFRMNSLPQLIQQNIKSIQSTVSQMKKYSLPESIEHIIFHHLRDLYLILDRVYDSKENSLWQQLTRQLQSKQNITQSNKKHADFTNLNYLQFYYDCILQISHYSSELVEYLQDEYWKQIIKTIKIIYQPNRSSNIQVKSNIDIQELFQIQRLIILSSRSNDMKLSDLQRVIEQIIKRIMRKFYNLAFKQKIDQIIKFTLMIQYLQKVYNISQNGNIMQQSEKMFEEIVLLKVRKFIIMSLINEIFLKQNYQNKNSKYFKIRSSYKYACDNLSLLIQSQMYLPSVDNFQTIFKDCNFLTPQRLSLLKLSSENMKSLKKQVEPLQLTLGKTNSSSIRLTTDIKTLFNFESIIYDWQKISNDRSFIDDLVKNNGRTISEKYVQLELISNLIKWGSNVQFQLSESVFVKKQIKKNYYLQQQAQKLHTISGLFAKYELKINYYFEEVHDKAKLKKWDQNMKKFAEEAIKLI